MDARVSPDHHLLLTLPQDFPAGPVRVTIESVRRGGSARAPIVSARSTPTGAPPAGIGRRDDHPDAGWGLGPEV